MSSSQIMAPLRIIWLNFCVILFFLCFILRLFHPIKLWNEYTSSKSNIGNSDILVLAQTLVLLIGEQASNLHIQLTVNISSQSCSTSILLSHFGIMISLISHMFYYNCSINLTYFHSLGFLLGISIVTQILSGLILTSSFSSSAPFSCIISIQRNVYAGYLYRYYHCTLPSIIFILIYLHILKAFYAGSLIYLHLVLTTGLLLYVSLMVIGFLGYVLPFGQMSFWGSTVILNFLNLIPDLTELISGGYFIHLTTIQRLLVIHFILPFIVIIIIFTHLLFLHQLSSHSPFVVISILFSYYLLLKDILILFLLIGSIFYQFYSFLIISHSDNSLSVNQLITPHHIVPEWYFLFFYSILKCIPSKYCGLIILMSILITLILLSSSILIFGNVLSVLTVQFSSRSVAFCPSDVSLTSHAMSRLITSQFHCQILVFLSLPHHHSPFNLYHLVTIIVVLSHVGSQLPKDRLIHFGRLLLLNINLFALLILHLSYSRITEIN